MVCNVSLIFMIFFFIKERKGEEHSRIVCRWRKTHPFSLRSVTPMAKKTEKWRSLLYVSTLGKHNSCLFCPFLSFSPRKFFSVSSFFSLLAPFAYTILFQFEPEHMRCSRFCVHAVKSSFHEHKFVNPALKCRRVIFDIAWLFQPERLCSGSKTLRKNWGKPGNLRNKSIFVSCWINQISPFSTSLSRSSEKFCSLATAFFPSLTETWNLNWDRMQKIYLYLLESRRASPEFRLRRYNSSLFFFLANDKVSFMLTTYRSSTFFFLNDFLIVLVPRSHLQLRYRVMRRTKFHVVNGSRGKICFFPFSSNRKRTHRTKTKTELTLESREKGANW